MSRRDILAIVLGVGILVLLGVAYIGVPDFHRKVNAGFGPDWDCTPQARGDPVCIKKTLDAEGGQRAAQP